MHSIFVLFKSISEFLICLYSTITVSDLLYLDDIQVVSSQSDIYLGIELDQN